MSDYRWYPYSFKQGLVWGLQGALIPPVIFTASLVIIAIWALITGGADSVSEAIAIGLSYAIFGYLLSFGGFGLTMLISDKTLSWKTTLRVLGFILGIVVMFNLINRYGISG